MTDSPDYNLLKTLCAIHSPSGEEATMKKFLLDYINEHVAGWRVKPSIYAGNEFQDCLMLVFGTPKIAAFAHMDTTGFMVRYQDQLIPIGSPEVQGGERLTGRDLYGEIDCYLELDPSDRVRYRFARGILTGTSLTFAKEFRCHQSIITAPYLDNRVGIYNLLRLAEKLENGALVFTCWEESGGGSVPFLVRFLYEQFQIKKMLVSDVTWATDGIAIGSGVVISRRDRNIPRKVFIDQITHLARYNEVKYQIEVEDEGSSDGREIQLSPYPIDWCFVGLPVEKVHSCHEQLAIADLLEMEKLYAVLMKNL